MLSLIASHPPKLQQDEDSEVCVWKASISVFPLRGGCEWDWLMGIGLLCSKSLLLCGVCDLVTGSKHLKWNLEYVYRNWDTETWDLLDCVSPECSVEWCCGRKCLLRVIMRTGLQLEPCPQKNIGK